MIRGDERALYDRYEHDIIVMDELIELRGRNEKKDHY